MSLTIRIAIPMQDFESVAALLTIAEHEPVSKAQLLENQQHIADGQIRYQIVAETDGKIVGYGTVFHTPWMKNGRFVVKVWTHPDQQDKGIGKQLYDTASVFAQNNGA